MRLDSEETVHGHILEAVNAINIDGLITCIVCKNVIVNASRALSHLIRLETFSICLVKLTKVRLSFRQPKVALQGLL